MLFRSKIATSKLLYFSSFELMRPAFISVFTSIWDFVNSAPMIIWASELLFELQKLFRDQEIGYEKVVGKLLMLRSL